MSTHPSHDAILASTSGLFPIVSLPRLFRAARRSAGSGEAVAGIFADSDGGFCAYPAGTPVRVVSPRQFSVTGRFPPVEALHGGLVAVARCATTVTPARLGSSHTSSLPE